MLFSLLTYRIPLRTVPLALFMCPQMIITICLLASITRFCHIVIGIITLIGIMLYFTARVISQLQQAHGVRAPTVDLEEVFEDVGEAVESAEVDDVFPDMGIRYGHVTGFVCGVMHSSCIIY